MPDRFASFDAPERGASAGEGVKLPQFASPPVVEVVISVQFEELSGFQLVDFGLLWERLKARYPKTERQDPLLPVVERFGRRKSRPAEIRIEHGVPLGRCWYRSEDDRRLVQVQPDRFLLNWVKADEEAEYPSYETLRKDFDRELQSFLEFVRERDLGSFEPVQCELTYVNHLRQAREGNEARELPRILAPWAGTASSAFLPEVEDARLNWQYRFDDADGPLGRLHVVLNSAVRESDNEQVITLQLIGRGAPRGSDVESVLDFTDRAHEWIVRGFADITTQPMHELWKRES